MKVLRCCLIVLITVFLTGACAASADVIGKTDMEVKAIATPALDGMLEGFKTGDYPAYSRDFDVKLKDAIPEEEFGRIRLEVNDRFGFCEGKTYLGFLTKGKTTVVLWKGRFEKSADDILIRLTMIKKGNKDYVTNLMFQ